MEKKSIEQITKSREKLIFSYLQALDDGDLDAIEMIIQKSQQDKELEQTLSSIDSYLQEEIESEDYHHKDSRNYLTDKAKPGYFQSLFRWTKRTLNPLRRNTVSSPTLHVKSTYSSRIEIPINMRSHIYSGYTAVASIGVPGAFAPTPALGIVSWALRTMTVNLANEAGHTISEYTSRKLYHAVTSEVIDKSIGVFKIKSPYFIWLLRQLCDRFPSFTSILYRDSFVEDYTWAYGRAFSRYFLQTDKFEGIDDDDIEGIVAVLIALIGAELGSATEYDHLIAR